MNIAEKILLLFQEYMTWYDTIRNKSAHLELQNAQVDHLWEQYTNFESWILAIFYVYRDMFYVIAIYLNEFQFIFWILLLQV